MKKIIFLYAIVLVMLCTACSNLTEIIDLEEKETEKEVEKGTVMTEPLSTIEPARGVFEDNIYTNEVFGISFSISENAYVFTDEEIYQSLKEQYSFIEDLENELEDDVFTATEMEQVFKGNIHDVIIYDETTCLSVLYVNMDTIYGERLTKEEYLTSLQSQVQQQDPEIFILPNIRLETLGGEEYGKLEVTYSDGTHTVFYARVVENYVISIGFSSNGGVKEAMNFRDSFINITTD